MILILEHRKDDLRPIAPRVLGPEPARRKCSARQCLQRLGVHVPVRAAVPPRARAPAAVGQAAKPGALAPRAKPGALRPGAK